MTNADLQQSLYWLAGNMPVWLPIAYMALVGLIVGIAYLIAIALRDGSE